jgi:hypothetical protein
VGFAFGRFASNGNDVFEHRDARMFSLDLDEQPLDDFAKTVQAAQVHDLVRFANLLDTGGYSDQHGIPHLAAFAPDRAIAGASRHADVELPIFDP